jgi:hypothetical protein
MNENELKAEMDAATTQVGKIGGETDSLKAEIETLKQQVADLDTQLANQQVSDETMASWNALKDQIGVVDQKVDDLPSAPSAPQS